MLLHSLRLFISIPNTEYENVLFYFSAQFLTEAIYNFEQEASSVVWSDLKQQKLFSTLCVNYMPFSLIHILRVGLLVGMGVGGREGV
jgi:hypothetical protein